MNTLNDFSFLLPHFLNIVNSVSGITPGIDRDWIVDADRIALKYSTNLLTISYLLEGTKPSVASFNNINFIDFYSIFAIARSAFESYLTLYYIFVDPNATEEEKKYRHSLWLLSSLGNRQRTTVLSQPMREALARELNQIQSLQQEIRVSPFFNGQSTRRRTRDDINAGRTRIDWKPDGGWGTLANRAGINQRFYVDVYNLFSSVTHSENVIANYADNASNREKQLELSQSAISTLNVITSCFIKSYALIFQPVASYLDNYNDLKEKVEILESLKNDNYENAQLP